MSWLLKNKRRNIRVVQKKQFLNYCLRILYFFFIGAAFCICSCATTTVKDDRPFIWITDNSKFILLPPQNIERPLDEYQLMSASFAGQNYYMISWVKADDAGIDIVLLNEMGANLGELIWRDGNISFSSTVLPSSLPPEYIIADFQLCFYNSAALAQALKKSGLSLVETETARHIYMKKDLIIEIIKNQKSITLSNHLRGYTYTMEGGL